MTDNEIFEFGLIENGKVIETFEDKDTCFQRFLEFKDRTNLGFRRLQFNELTEERKLQVMEQRLERLTKFLQEIEGSGRTYQSHTHIHAEELTWLIENTKRLISYQS